MAVDMNIAGTIGTQATLVNGLYAKLAATSDPTEITKLSAMIGLQSSALESLRKAADEAGRALVGKQ